MTGCRTFRMTPYDSLFFRDGRPFQQDDEGLGEAVTVFPPSPRTTANALRAALARAHGWSEHGGEWPANLLGDGDDLRGNGDDLRGLRFAGPIPALGDTFFLRSPAFLGKHEVKPFALAQPIPSGAVQADIGHGGLAFEEAGAQPYKAAGGWLTAEGMRQVLEGEAPKAAHFRAEPLVRIEPRIGLRRDKARHMAQEGMLYQASRIRPVEDGDARLSLLVGVEGVDIDPQRLSPLGGDTRLAAFEPNKVSIDQILADLRIVPELADEVIEYVAILVTPGEHCCAEKLPGETVVVASDRPVVIGGWSLGRPAESVAMMPAGTAYFQRFKGSKHDLEKKLDAAVKARLAAPERAAFGFGEFVYGWWPINV